MKKIIMAFMCVALMGFAFQAAAASYSVVKKVDNITRDDQNRMVICYNSSCTDAVTVAYTKHTPAGEGFPVGTDVNWKNNRILYRVPGGQWTEVTEDQIVATEGRPVMVTSSSVPLNAPEATVLSPLPPTFSVRNFPTGQYTITPEMEAELWKIVEYAKTHPQEIFVIHGYVSNLKYKYDNDNRQRQLVMNRAFAIDHWLLAHGVPQAQMVIQEVYAIGIEPGTNYQNQRVDIWTVSYAQLFERLTNKPCDPCPDCPKQEQCQAWPALPGDIKVTINKPDYCEVNWRIDAFNSRIENGVRILMIDLSITIDVSCQERVVERIVEVPIPGDTTQQSVIPDEPKQCPWWNQWDCMSKGEKVAVAATTTTVVIAAIICSMKGGQGANSAGDGGSICSFK